MRRTKITSLLAGLGLVTCSTVAHATLLPITNASFEATGNMVNAQLYQGAPADDTANQVPGWFFQCDSNAGVNDRSSDYPLSQGALPGGTGIRLGFFNNPTATQVAQAFTAQDFVIAENTVYTLTVALGNRLGTNAADGGYHDPGNYSIQLLTDFHNLVVKRDINPTPGTGTDGGIADGSLRDFSVSFTSGAMGVDPLVGHALLAQIQVTATADAQQSTFDDVRLDATGVIVPEPVTAGILGASMLVLRRRRGA